MNSALHTSTYCQPVAFLRGLVGGVYWCGSLTFVRCDYSIVHIARLPARGAMEVGLFVYVCLGRGRRYLDLFDVLSDFLLVCRDTAVYFTSIDGWMFMH